MSCAPNAKREGGGCTSGGEGGGTRRAMLQGAGAAITTLAAGVTLVAFSGATSAARKPHEKATANERWGLLIDGSKCADGCTACISACRIENGWRDRGHVESVCG